MIPFPHLTDELISFAKKKRAETVYIKCLRAGKRTLAKKIAKKYEIRSLFQHDLVVATGLALMSSIKLNEF